MCIAAFWLVFEGSFAVFLSCIVSAPAQSPVPRVPLDCIIMCKREENMKDTRMNRNTKRHREREERERETDPPENTQRVNS